MIPSLALKYNLLALKYDPHNIEAMKLLAQIYILEFNLELAWTIYKEIIKIEPTLQNKYPNHK